MKVTIQYYDKEADVRNGVAAIVSKRSLVLETKDDFFQSVTVPDKHAADALMKDLSPLPNIQIAAG